MAREEIVIVTPALANTKNGNWLTAHRWSAILTSAYRVRLAEQWDGGNEDLLIALHARRSAASAARWRAQRPASPLALVLTGTDLYRDITVDAQAQASLHVADRLIVLNQLGVASLPAALRAKAAIVLQSCGARPTLAKTGRHLRALMVGHLREEKSPQTFFDAARLLVGRDDIWLDHIGAALDAGLGRDAAALTTGSPGYRWLGALPREATRRRIQAAHLLVHPSRMEGGAHVVIEALRSGTPVLASRIDGNVGLLGEGYEGYFPVGDAAALASALQRLRDDPAMLAELQHQCVLRAPLFDPAQESATLHALVAELMTKNLKAHP